MTAGGVGVHLRLTVAEERAHVIEWSVGCRVLHHLFKYSEWIAADDPSQVASQAQVEVHA